jgi:hypothetical protein
LLQSFSSILFAYRYLLLILKHDIIYEVRDAIPFYKDVAPFMRYPDDIAVGAAVASINKVVPITVWRLGDGNPVFRYFIVKAFAILQFLRRESAMPEYGISSHSSLSTPVGFLQHSTQFTES